jgi:alpha-tubulin suppressor-like RCC1 family protein
MDGFEHTCVTTSGALWCWGDNARSQLGLGDVQTRRTPVRVSEFDDFVDLCAGEAHTCALRASGTLYCWGSNEHGQLGLGDLAPRSTPTALPASAFVRVACGGENTCALSAEGALYCWGNNLEGQNGQGDAAGTPDLSTPTRVAPELAFYDVSVGQGHVCAVTRGGALYCWGRNTQGQLGVSTENVQLRSPQRVDPGRTYRTVSAGQAHSCGITRQGQLVCWGVDERGRLGLGPSAGDRPLGPTPVGDASDYVRVRAAWFQTCALRAGGRLFCWGRNVEGQLGVGDYADRDSPAEVAPSGWLDVTVAHFHSCGLRAGDEVYCWGENDASGQLGIGDQGRRNQPTQALLP